MPMLHSGSVDPSSERFKQGNDWLAMSLKLDGNTAFATPLKLDISESCIPATTSRYIFYF